MPTTPVQSDTQAIPTRWRAIAGPLLLVACGMLATVGLWGDFQLFGHSSVMDHFRQLEFHRCFSDGALWPRWLPDAYYGYGSPLFSFYSPLPFYVTEAFILGGLAVHSAIKATFILSTILSGLTMYLFCRDFAGRSAAFLSGAAYMVVPYHLVDLFVRHAMGEHLAFVFVPLAAWGLTGMLRGQRWCRLPVGSLALAALILTHNVTAMLGMGALLLWWTILALRVRDRRHSVWGAGVLAGGLALAAFFWIPTFAEKDQLHLSSTVTAGYFNHREHFVYPFQLLKPSWGYGTSAPGAEADGMSFQVGIAHWLFVLGGVVLLATRARKRPDVLTPALFGLVLFTVSIILTLPISLFAYEHVPLLHYTQFPWRFLLFAAFASSILAGSLELLANSINRSWAPKVTLAASMIIVVICYARYATPKAGVYFKREAAFGLWSTKHLAELNNTGNVVHAYQVGTAEFYRNQGQTGTVMNEYLPITVDLDQAPRQASSSFAQWRGEGTPTVQASARGPVDLSATIATENPGQVEFSRFYFPGWQASVDGTPTPIAPRPKVGTILVPVEAGEHVIELHFGLTRIRFGSFVFSLLALCAIIAYGIWSRRRSREKPAVSEAV